MKKERNMKKEEIKRKKTPFSERKFGACEVQTAIAAFYRETTPARIYEECTPPANWTNGTVQKIGPSTVYRPFFPATHPCMSDVCPQQFFGSSSASALLRAAFRASGKRAREMHLGIKWN